MNPYLNLPASAFWRRSISALPPEEVDPVTDVPFRIARADAVATAGSCFAQHISRTLMADGFRYLVTEAGPATAGALDQNYGVFPARFANIYTVRQLLQLFQRAYGTFAPVDEAWERADGSFVDPFRPRIQEGGFASREALLADRAAHLAAVRDMFENCDVFVFTLGLTEAWVSTRDGAAFPLAAGVVAEKADPAWTAFKNFTVAEMVRDLTTFVDWVRRVNPGLRIILTVSPVPLIATYEPRHVLVSTVASKAALRVVADEVSRSLPDVAYFPSFEIITGPQAGARHYEPDLREVRPEGVAHVMSIFRRHFLGEGAVVPRVNAAPAPAPQPRGKVAPAPPPIPRPAAAADRMRDMEAIICDEEALDVPAMGATP